MAATSEQLALAALNRTARRAVAKLPDNERAMMMMRGTFAGRAHSLVDVAKSFHVDPQEVRAVENKVFQALGPEWMAAWREAHEATRTPANTPWHRERHRVVFHAFVHRPAQRGRSRAARCGTRRTRGSRRIGARAGPSDESDPEPPSPSRRGLTGRSLAAVTPWAVTP